MIVVFGYVVQTRGKHKRKSIKQTFKCLWHSMQRTRQPENFQRHSLRVIAITSYFIQFKCLLTNIFNENPVSLLSNECTAHNFTVVTLTQPTIEALIRISNIWFFFKYFKVTHHIEYRINQLSNYHDDSYNSDMCCILTFTYVSKTDAPILSYEITFR